jgi:biotin operon repressor
MTATQSLKIFQILNVHFKNETDATKLVEAIEAVVDEKVGSKTEVFEKIVTKDIDSLRQEMYKVFSTKQDASEIKAELTKTIYIVGLVQFLAIVGSVIGIISFIMKK